jgi:manganese transport protein
LSEQLQRTGHQVQWALGMGNPAVELSRMVNEIGADLLILGAHGHMGVSDLLHGTTVSNLRHLVRAAVLVVPLDMPVAQQETANVAAQ